MLYESINIPLQRALSGVRGKRFLDVGCGTGALGELLVKSGNRVEGITWSQEEAAIALTRIEKVYVQDLNSPSFAASIASGPYDALIFADVLEHLVEPKRVLETFAARLAPEGKVYVSLPNIACFHVRLGLLTGRFDMSKTGGVLDETHLHHFTLDTAKALLREAGLKVERIDFMPGISVWLYQTFLKKIEPATALQRAERKDLQLYEKYFYPAEHWVASIWKRMFAEQFVFICRRGGE